MQVLFLTSYLLASLVTSETLSDSHIELAKVYYYQKKYDEALKQLKDMPPHEPALEEELLYADIYLAKKEYSQAEEIYRRLSVVNSEKQDMIRLKLAELLSWQKRYEESLALYKELLEKHPDDNPLRRKYAEVLLWSGNEEEAAKELEKTLRKK